MKVLIVDDNEINRKLLRVTLSSGQHETAEAADGVEALGKLRSEKFDAVISDILMPRMDGYRLCHEVRRDLKLRDLPIIIYSSTYTSSADEHVALSEGADRFIRKPASAAALLEALQELARHAGARPARPHLDSEVDLLKYYSERLVQKLEDKNIRLEEAADHLAAANEEIRRSEEQVRLLLDSTAEGIYGLDLEGKFTFCNAACLSLLGYTGAGDLLGKEEHAAIHHTCADGTPNPLEECGSYRSLREDGGNHADDEVFWRPDGTGFPAEYWSYPVRKDGRVVGAVVTFLDITQRKRAQESLRKSEKRFALAFEASPIPTSITEISTDRLLDVNDQFVHVVGYPREELIGHTWLELEIWANHADRDRIGNRLLQEGAVRNEELQIRTRSGDIRDVVGSLVRIEVGSLPCVLSTFLDVTESKRAEKEMRKSEERFRRLFESNTIGIVIADLSGGILESNDAYLDMLGYTREELLSGKVRWDEMTPPEYRDRDRLAVEQLRRTGVAVPWEKDMLRKDGTRVPVLLGIAILEASEGSCIAYIVDLSTRRQLEEQLRQAQKMEAIGQLAGGVAHDFNNLLTAILGYSDLLATQLGEQSALLESVEEIRKAGESAASLTRQLLAFSRRQVLEPKVLDLNALVQNLEKILRRLVGEDVSLVTLLDPDVQRIRAEAGQIEQVIVNVAVNARDAMPKGGIVTIETANVELDEAYAREHASVRPGAYVMLAVTDTGIGMSAETKSHMFEPFFTTKERGKGTGLGLATVYGIVKQSGGDIWVYSEVGRGTAFKIYLPAVEGAVEETDERSLPGPCPGGTETVLLVEDEQSVRTMSRTILESHGYKVLEAGGAGEALEVARDHGGPIHLLLTDVVMPEMDGSDMASSIATLRPEINVLYMSGYADDAIVRHGLIAEGGHFLQKPFTPDGLAHKVREILDRGP